MWAYRLLIILVISCFSLSCSSGESHPSSSKSIDSARVGTHLLQLEIADTPDKRAQGLMYRRELGDNSGMLFVFPESKVQTFWMKNTPLSLDIIFLDEELRVVGVAEKTTPFSTEQVSVGKPSRYVLEVKAGRAKELGLLTPGTQLEWPIRE